MAWIDRHREKAARAFRRINRKTGIYSIRIVGTDEDGEQLTLYTVHGNWFFENIDQNPSGIEDAGAKDIPQFWIAENSDELISAMDEATHIVLGEREYTIHNPDIMRPNPTTEPLWKIPCVKDLV